MNIAVIGATGMAGSAIVAEALPAATTSPRCRGTRRGVETICFGPSPWTLPHRTRSRSCRRFSPASTQWCWPCGRRQARSTS